ncbi:MAG: hypothetical protein PUE59_02810 [Treponema sp.]|nr:hypothetical protein [Treponema sp.]
MSSVFPFKESVFFIFEESPSVKHNEIILFSFAFARISSKELSIVPIKSSEFSFEKPHQGAMFPSE